MNICCCHKFVSPENKVDTTEVMRFDMTVTNINTFGVYILFVIIYYSYPYNLLLVAINKLNKSSTNSSLKLFYV